MNGPAVPVAVDDARCSDEKALKLAPALQGDDDQAFVERFVNTDGDMSTARARFGPPQVDGLKTRLVPPSPISARGFEPVPVESPTPTPPRRPRTAGGTPVTTVGSRALDLLRNRFVPVNRQGLRRLVISQGFQQSGGHAPSPNCLSISMDRSS
jgi:hypothetical protein